MSDSARACTHLTKTTVYNIPTSDGGLPRLRAYDDEGTIYLCPACYSAHVAAGNNKVPDFVRRGAVAKLVVADEIG